MWYGSAMYFYDEEDANDWLDFQCDPEEAEERSYAENDRFEEWRQWRDAWADRVQP